MSEMKFKDAAEFEKFSKTYQEHLKSGLSSEEAMAETRAEFWPEEGLTEEERKAYRRYVDVNRLSSEEALHLAKRKAPEAKPAEKKEEPKRKADLLDVTKWYDDWMGSAWKTWMDRFKPLTGVFDDDFFGHFGRDWLDWDGLGRYRKGLGCSCGCGNEKKDKAPAKKEESAAPAKPVDDAVEKEVKKVLDSIPSDEVNDQNTKVKIFRNKPDDYEFKIDHTSPNGSTFSSYTRKYVKS